VHSGKFIGSLVPLFLSPLALGFQFMSTFKSLSGSNKFIGFQNDIYRFQQKIVLAKILKLEIIRFSDGLLYMQFDRKFFFGLTSRFTHVLLENFSLF
jgi:hypothetical protein